MNMNNIYIKNMVCARCIYTVTDIFKENGILPQDVKLGIVTLSHPLSVEILKKVQDKLEAYGFELIDDQRMRLIEQIRIGVIEFVHNPRLQDIMNLSGYLQDKCYHEYSFLSKLFSEMKGISIEKYYINQRIELVKELLFYDELTISEIADQLHYSSVAHLSGQFKSMTGMSPTQFKQMKGSRLKSLDEI